MSSDLLLIIAAFLALLAACYLLGAARRHAVSILLALGFVACVAQQLFDYACLVDPGAVDSWKTGTLIAEAVLPVGFAWSAALTGCRFGQLSLMLRGLLFGLPLLLIPALVYPPSGLLVNPDFGAEPLLFLTRPGYLFYLLLLLSLTIALVLQERSFARLKRLERWHLKFEYLGIGSILAVQLLYYSQGLLYRSLDMSLAPARSLSLIVGVLLLAYSRYRRGYPDKLAMSHEVAFRSLVVLGVGAYLFILGLAGEGLRYFGADFNRGLLLFMAVLGGLALMVLVLSEQLRRKTTVWLHKHFFRQKYDYRAHWMEFTRRLALARESDALRLTILESYCQTFGLRDGVLYLAEDDQGDYRPLAAFEISLPTRNVARESPLARFLAERRWVFNRDDRDCDVILAAHPTMFGEDGTHFVVPLFFADRLEGLLALGAPINTGESITYEDYDLMKALAAQAASVLHGQRLLKQLASSHEMAAIGKVSAFVMHDLKNAVSNLALVVDNAREYMNDPEFQQDMLETLDNSVARMRGLIDRLKNFTPTAVPELERCDLKQLAAAVAADFPAGSVSLAGEPVAALADRGDITRVVVNLVLNALDATGGAGPVRLRVGERDGLAAISCSDDGEGMAANFIRERLFRPFETTKAKGFGIGLYQCQQIIATHGGRIEVQSEPGQGSEFTVWLPKGQEDEIGDG